MTIGRTTVFVSFVASMLLMSCVKSKPKPTIPYDRMVDILTDLYVAEEISRDHPIVLRDSINLVLAKSLHRVYNTTQSEIDSNLYLYETDYVVYRQLLKDAKLQLDSISNSSIPKEVKLEREEKRGENIIG